MSDRDGFEEYVAARRTALLRTAYLLTGHHEDAEDLVQLALIKVVPHRQRAVIVLRYNEDLTERQTAEVLGIAVGTVKSQARDGLARLRDLVPGLGLGDDALTPAAP